MTAGVFDEEYWARVSSGDTSREPEVHLNSRVELGDREAMRDIYYGRLHVDVNPLGVTFLRSSRSTGLDLDVNPLEEA